MRYIDKGGVVPISQYAIVKIDEEIIIIFTVKKTKNNR